MAHNLWSSLAGENLGLPCTSRLAKGARTDPKADAVRSGEPSDRPYTLKKGDWPRFQTKPPSLCAFRLERSCTLSRCHLTVTYADDGQAVIQSRRSSFLAWNERPCVCDYP